MNGTLTISFHGMQVQVIKGDDKYYWIPVKKICDNIGIDFKRQSKQIKSNEVMSWGVYIDTSGSQKRKVFCVRKDFLGGWLFTIQVAKIKNEKVRQKLLTYQKEICKVIDDYLTFGFAVNTAFSPIQREQLLDYIAEKPELSQFISNLNDELSEYKPTVLYGEPSKKSGIPRTILHRSTYFPRRRTPEEIEKDKQKKSLDDPNQMLLPFDNQQAIGG